MLVYVTAALSVVASPGVEVYVGAAVSLAYLIGLTYAAKKEHLDRLDHAWPDAMLVGWGALAVRRLFRRGPGDVPKAVVALIAGISLLDAVLLAGHAAAPALGGRHIRPVATSGDPGQPTGTVVPVIDRNRCEGKAACVAVCPTRMFVVGVLPQNARGGLWLRVRLKGFASGWRQALIADPEACQACGRCVTACPEKSITLARRDAKAPQGRVGE